MRRSVRSWLGLIIAVLGTMCLAACGSSSSSSSTSSGSSSGTAAAATSASSTSSCAATAESRVRAAEAPFNFTTPTGALTNVSSLRGKTVFYIPVEQQAALYAPYQAALTQAAHLVGANLVLFNGNAAPPTENQGVLEAVNRHASGLILLAVTPAFVQTPLSQGLKGGMKVIDVLNGAFTSPLNGLYTHIAPSLAELGRIQADEALAATGCHLTAGILYESAFEFAIGVKDGATAEIASLCPSCHVYTQDVNAAEIPTQTPSLVASMKTAHPGLNALLAANDKTSEYILPELKSLGDTSVKVFGVNAEPTELQNMSQGGAMAGDVFYSPYGYMGWETAYQMFRAVLGLPSTATALSAQAVVPGNVSAVEKEANSTSFVSGFESALK
jgi:ribose transport system substrate-binding protein